MAIRMIIHTRVFLIAGMVLTSWGAWNSPAAAESLQLAVPLECTLGGDCFVQNYVDHGAGSDYRDYHCGAMTYEGHNGTDFRIPSINVQKQGVNVRAAADGKVKAIRDSMPDALLTSATKADVAGEECGNGVVIDHKDGWQTQYCHMALGSITVKPGSRVTRGMAIGRVGLSGATEFPHLHLTVRHNGEVIDPFAPSLAPGSCSEKQGPTLFDDKDLTFDYHDRIVLNFGFVDGPVTGDEIEQGELKSRLPDHDSNVIAAYVRVMGLKKNDVQTFAIIGPDGEPIVRRVFEPLAGPKAQNSIYIGLKKPKEGWKLGIYSAIYSVSEGTQPKTDKWFFLQF
jgi:hypothetical protein